LFPKKKKGINVLISLYDNEMGGGGGDDRTTQMMKSQGSHRSEVENAKTKNFTHAESPLVNHVQTCYDDQMKREQMKKLSVQPLIIGYGPVKKEKIEGGLVFFGKKKQKK